MNKLWKVAFFVIFFFVSTTACTARSRHEHHTAALAEQSPTKGNPNAPVTIVEFSDFECPFCGLAQPALKEVQNHYPSQVRFVFKNFPLRMHRHAWKAHLAALCAENQGKFWEYKDLLFQHQRELRRADLIRYANELNLAAKPFENCLDSEKYGSQIDRELEEAHHLGIDGTPAFLVNGKLIMGAQPFSSFQQIIDEELFTSSHSTQGAGRESEG